METARGGTGYQTILKRSMKLYSVLLEPIPVTHLFFLFWPNRAVNEFPSWGKKTPELFTYLWARNAGICLAYVAGIKRGKGWEGSGGGSSGVIKFDTMALVEDWNRQTASISCNAEIIIPWWNYCGYRKLGQVWGKTIFRNSYVWNLSPVRWSSKYQW